MSGADCYDLAIVGGGMVGASLATALAGRGLRIAVIEAVPLRAAVQPSYDDRVIALAYGTRRIFQGMGLWEALAPHVTPIHKIHISDRGHFGATRLDCREERVEALGYVAESRVLGQVLGARLSALPGVDLFCPATVEGVAVDAAAAQLTMQIDGAPHPLAARLVVAADGAQSGVRQQLDMPTVQWDYGQSAVITNVTPARPHLNIAYERFTGTGPLALLPMSDNRCSVVWTVRSDDAERVQGLDDATFLAGLAQRFGRRLGRLQRVGKRVVYPLTLVRAKEPVRPRVALIGNAAHTLHPVAGQGFNLGLRDVAVMAEVLAQAAADGRDLGSLDVLRHYEGWRKRDHLKVIGFTDGLARIFANPLPPVAWARDMGLVAVDLVAPFKHALTRQTMGLAGRLPKLARGLPL